MGRFNWTWKTLRTLSVVMCGVWLPGTASAFDAEEQRAEDLIVILGDITCRVVMLVDPMTQTAMVSLLSLTVGRRKHGRRGECTGKMGMLWVIDPFKKMN